VKRPSLEFRIAVALIAMAMLTLAIWLGTNALALPLWMTVLLLLAACALIIRMIPDQILAPLVSLASVIDAMRAGDYAQRLRTDRYGIAGELAVSVNLLSETWGQRERSQRETDALLAKLLHEIDLAIFTFDHDHRLVLANRAARELVGLRLEPGTTALALELEQFLTGSHPEPAHLVFPGGVGRFLVRRRPFRIDGRAHQLLVLTNAEAALGAERREAWQSLVRVLGHEINNSLSPIKSIAQTLATAQAQAQKNGGNPQSSPDMIEALNLIASRADALGRFVAGYAALARLPQPQSRAVSLQPLIRRVTDLEGRMEISLEGPDLSLVGDPDQLEQALINLVRNAVDAVEDRNGEVSIRWFEKGTVVQIEIQDNGPGPPDSDNLFVPFFTTKPGGSGIGLLLSRRIAELHGGSLELIGLSETGGALARLTLPGGRTTP